MDAPVIEFPSNGKRKLFKYNEDKALRDFYSHIESTYGKYYVGDDGKNIQVQDLILATGHGESFYIGNILKYISRYGKKDGFNRLDLLKTAHYLCLLYVLRHLEEEENSNDER